MNFPVLLFSEFIGVVAVIRILSITPALKNRRRLNFKYPGREGGAALSIGVLIVVATAALVRVAGADIAQAGQFSWYPSLLGAPALPAITPAAIAAQIFFTAALVLIVAASVYLRKQPLLSIGLGRNTQAGLQLGLALALLTIFIHGKISLIIRGMAGSGTNALIMAVLTVVGEEVVFRGYIQPRLSSWLGDWRGLLATAGLSLAWWSVVAIGFLPLTGLALVGAIIYRLLLEVLLGWLMKESNSLLAPVIYHLAHLWVAFL
jgi:membrane protease YdiL (CAAX protease family)